MILVSTEGYLVVAQWSRETVVSDGLESRISGITEFEALPGEKICYLQKISLRRINAVGDTAVKEVIENVKYRQQVHSGLSIRAHRTMKLLLAALFLQVLISEQVCSNMFDL